MNTNVPRAARLVNLIAAATHVYLAALAAWALLHLAAPDRWWWLFLLSAAAPYLLASLAALLPALLLLRLRRAAAACAALLACAAAICAPALLPAPRAAGAAPAGPALRVMTYNVFGFNPSPERVVAAIRASGADVVALQELSPEVAGAIRQALADVYPHQLLDPQVGVTGMGTISRLPIRPAAERLQGMWMGEPQVLLVDLGGAELTLVNFHATPPFVRIAGDTGPDAFSAAVRSRERQAEALAAMARGRSGPLVALGDLNANELSVAYRTLTAELQDAWRAAGNAVGGATWPAAATFGEPQAPSWLIRIDHVFASAELAPTAAAIGPWDGGSDHRPVVVTLRVGR